MQGGKLWLALHGDGKAAMDEKEMVVLTLLHILQIYLLEQSMFDT